MGDGQDLVRAEVGRLEAGRRLGEGAVSAPVSAQHGQRNEDLRAVGDPSAVVGVPDGPGGF